MILCGESDSPGVSWTGERGIIQHRNRIQKLCKTLVIKIKNKQRSVGVNTLVTLCRHKENIVYYIGNASCFKMNHSISIACYETIQQKIKFVWLPNLHHSCLLFHLFLLYRHQITNMMPQFSRFQPDIKSPSVSPLKEENIFLLLKIREGFMANF